MKIDLLAIGELLADFISHEYVNTVSEAKSFEMFQGGSPANLCANVRWLGKNAQLIACVGNDSIGDFLIKEIEKIGISSALITRSNEHPSSVVMIGKSTGTPDFIAYRMADTQIPPLSYDLLKDVNIIHTSAFALSKNPAQSNIIEALNYAKHKGAQVSVDWNFAKPIWGNDDGRSAFNYICSLQPMLKMSLDDYQRFLGQAHANAENARNFLDFLRVPFICLTCGSDGVWYKFDETWHFIAAKRVDEVKDTTGAGDAFWAAFLSAKLDGKNYHDCVNNAIEIAAIKIQKTGPLYV